MWAFVWNIPWIETRQASYAGGLFWVFMLLSIAEAWIWPLGAFLHAALPAGFLYTKTRSMQTQRPAFASHGKDRSTIKLLILEFLAVTDRPDSALTGHISAEVYEPLG